MTWIKRNLSLVISGVIALGLLGYGGWYLWNAKVQNDKIDDEIGGTTNEINRFLGMDPFPAKSNVDTAQREFQRVSAFIAQSKKLFPAPPVRPLDDRSFKSLLQASIDDLHKQAASVNIHVQSNYYFSFDAQRLPMRFQAESLRPLAERLHEVQVLSSNLFKARINRLETIKRAAVAGEPPNGPDYLLENVKTNAETAMTLWPYEIVFQSFSSERAAVLESLEQVPYGLVVKSLSVEPVLEQGGPVPGV